MHSNEKAILYTLITGLTVLTLLLVIFVFSIVHHQKKRMLGFKLQVLREFGLIEEERKRIAADLHDDIGSMLSFLKLQVTASHVIKHIDDTLLRIKAISHNLVPLTLVQEGLGAAIHELVYDYKAANLRITVNCNIADQIFVPVRALVVFRVIQEIMTNIIKHACARSITIDCNIKDQALVISIADDGIGFRVPEKKDPKKFGLRNIQSRLQLLNAVYTIASLPGKGTRYEINIPLISLK